jgi:hypothetical protein
VQPPEELHQPLLGLKTKALSGRARPCGPGHSPAPPPPPRPPWGPWPAAGNSSRPSSTSSTASSNSWSPRPPRHRWPCPGRGRHRRPAAGHHRRQPPAAALGGRPRPPVRRRPHPRVLGRTHRHRLNRGGDRRANHALWRIALVRMRCHPRPGPMSSGGPTKACPSSTSWVAEARDIAREIYHQLTSPPPNVVTACPK